MKMPPEYKKAQLNMAPGVITATGFLGNDERDLRDIITKDEEKMEYLGLDYIAVCEKLSYFMKEGEKGLGEFATIDDLWLARTLEARGHLPCPFEDGIYRKNTCEIVVKETGESLLFTSLSLHLIEVHHFHEVKGSDFRIDPEKIKKVLKM